MKFNDFLTEASTWDSEEATDFIDNLDRMINEPKLTAYLKETDNNYSTRTLSSLKKIQAIWKDLSDEFYNAE